MVRKFSEEFHALLNEDVPRQFMRSQDSRSGHLDESDYGKMINSYDGDYPISEDGFIAHYCKEKY